MQFAYHHHNKPEDVHNYLVDGLKAIDSAKVPDELREKAFELAVNLLANKTALGQESVARPGVLLGGHG